MACQVDEADAVTLIDFPQMVSTVHPNAEELYVRDIDGISRFFAKKLGYLPHLDAGASPRRPSFQVGNRLITHHLRTCLSLMWACPCRPVWRSE